MKHIVGVLAALILTVPVARMATAQTKTVTGETKEVTATVEAIEASTRTVTFKLPDGTYTQKVAPPDIQRFSEIKVGDKVTARYYENVVLRVKKPGEPDVDTSAQATTPSGQASPGGTRAKQRTITASITAIDPNVPSITFTGPKGYKYTSRVQDMNALAGVKVGDKVDLVWTEATLLSLQPAQ
jgi:Cu/Ag efflux protein CusF